MKLSEKLLKNYGETGTMQKFIDKCREEEGFSNYSFEQLEAIWRLIEMFPENAISNLYMETLWRHT